MRVPDPACSLSRPLGWISGMDFPPGPSLAGSAEGELWRDIADEPSPLPCSSFPGAGACGSVDSQEPLLLRMESFSHRGNGAGSSYPGIPWELQSPQEALECGAGFAIPGLRAFPAVPAVPACIITHTLCPWEGAGLGAGPLAARNAALHVQSPRNPGGGYGLLLPWKETFL